MHFPVVGHLHPCLELNVRPHDGVTLLDVQDALTLLTMLELQGYAF